MTTPFTHKMAAHCESGAVTALLRGAGMDVTESLVFGVSGAIFFGYLSVPMLPFPTIALRNKPGRIRIKTPERLGVKIRTRTFRDPEEATRELDALLERGIPVGAQVDYFYMDYLPEYTRAHFNAHYVIVTGKEAGRYLISDTYFPAMASLDAASFATARFARGQFAPKGLLFWPEAVPERPDLKAAVRQGIKDAVFYMVRLPLPFFGVRGIRFFARKVQGWPKLTRDLDHLSHEVMMIAVILEERGTGGGGFRYLYATFLQEAAKILGDPEVADVAREMMENGDRWREVSIAAARMGKRRDLGPQKLLELGDMIFERADAEQRIFRRLGALVK
jgi:hypothetical protein